MRFILLVANLTGSEGVTHIDWGSRLAHAPPTCWPRLAIELGHDGIRKPVFMFVKITLPIVTGVPFSIVNKYRHHLFDGRVSENRIAR